MKKSRLGVMLLAGLVVTMILFVPYLMREQLVKEIIESYPTLVKLDCEHAYVYIEGLQISQDFFSKKGMPCDRISIVKDSTEFRRIQKQWDKILFWTEMRQYSFFVISLTTVYVDNEALIFGQDYVWLFIGWFRIKNEFLGIS